MHAKGLAAFLSFLMLFLLLLTGCGGTQRSDPEQTTGSEQEPSSLRSASSETLPFSLKKSLCAEADFPTSRPNCCLIHLPQRVRQKKSAT